MLGDQKPDGVPKHKIPERTRESYESYEEKGDNKSLKACIRLKSCEPLYTCSRAPFYRETKGLLHSEIALESKEYSQCEHVHECLLHPVICEANFIHSQACHQFTLGTRTFEVTSLTWILLDLRSFIHENHRLSRFPN
jgi:hypothetical protein